jgi:hypothetical protein
MNSSSSLWRDVVGGGDGRLALEEAGFPYARIIVDSQCRVNMFAAISQFESTPTHEKHPYVAKRGHCVVNGRFQAKFWQDFHPPLVAGRIVRISISKSRLYASRAGQGT